MTDNNNMIGQQMMQTQQNGVSQQMMHNQQTQQNVIGQQSMLNQQVQQQLPQYNYQQPLGNPYYQSTAVNPYAGYQQWGNYQNTVQTQPLQQAQYTQQASPTQRSQDPVEYILLDGSAPNKKRKYVFVGEVDMQTNMVQPLPSFTLEDIRSVVAREFDVRFGEEKKK